MSEIDKIRSISRNIKKNLEKHGYKTIKKIVYANPIKLHKKLKLPEKEITNLIVNAKKIFVKWHLEKINKKEKKASEKLKPQIAKHGKRLKEYYYKSKFYHHGKKLDKSVTDYFIKIYRLEGSFFELPKNTVISIKNIIKKPSLDKSRSLISDRKSVKKKKVTQPVKKPKRKIKKSFIKKIQRFKVKIKTKPEKIKVKKIKKTRQFKKEIEKKPVKKKQIQKIKPWKKKAITEIKKLKLKIQKKERKKLTLITRKPSRKRKKLVRRVKKQDKLKKLIQDKQTRKDVIESVFDNL